ncbi:MAG: hypothetical protein ACRDZW_06205 [Acidimicrobiales bacterium]
MRRPTVQWVMAEESSPLGPLDDDARADLRVMHEQSRRYGVRVTHVRQDDVTRPAGGRRRVAPVSAGALATLVAAAYVATAGIAAVGAAVGFAAAGWARSRGRRPLRRFARWAARVGTEVLGNIPTPERPR